MTEVMVNVVATDPGTHLMIPYDQSLYGSHESTSRKLNVNKVANGYSIVIRDDIFARIDPGALMQEVCNVVNKNIHDDIGLSINYIYVKDRDDEFINDRIERTDFMLSDELWTNLYPSIYYRPIGGYRDNRYDDPIDVGTDPDDEDEELGAYDRGRRRIISMLEGNMSPAPDEEDDDDCSSGVRIVHDDREFYGGHIPDRMYSGSIATSGMWSDRNQYDDDDDDDYYDSIVETSHVMEKAKHPKRDIRRHGMIVVKNKKSMRKDAKMLEDVAEQLLPMRGRRSRKFYKELAWDWVRSYAITESEAKKIQREVQNSERNKVPKSRDEVTEAVAKLSSRIFGRG